MMLLMRLPTSRDLDPEDAETHNIAKLDSISRRSSSSSDRHYKQMHDLLRNDEDDSKPTSSSNSPHSKFVNAARRVAMLQKLSSSSRKNVLFNSKPTRGHRKSASDVNDLLGKIGVSNTDKDSGVFGDSHKHNLVVCHAAGIDTESSTSDTEEDEDEHEHEGNHEEDALLPVTTTYGTVVAAGIQETRRAKKLAASWQRCCQKAAGYCNPCYLTKRIFRVFINSFFLKIALPCFIVAWILYYT
jgi:hypothetical protein